jgi:hypothetical protein
MAVWYKPPEGFQFLGCLKRALGILPRFPREKSFYGEK